MSAYLIDHPPVRSQYRKPRRQNPSGVIVVHTAENAPDFVAFDGGAEAVARFIQSRTDPGSYHELVDSDSAILMVPYEYEAFHDATGSNPHSLSVSIATRADVWPLAPKEWRDGAVEQAAQAAARQARWLKAQAGIVVPAQRITRDESERGVPGFISHAQRDPTRRTDPGKDFPWSQFLARFSQLTEPGDDLMAAADDILEAIAAVRGDLKRLATSASLDAKPANERSVVERRVSATYHDVLELKAQLAALASVVGQLGAGGSVDYAKVEAAAEKAVKDVLGSIDN